MYKTLRAAFSALVFWWAANTTAEIQKGPEAPTAEANHPTSRSLVAYEHEDVPANRASEGSSFCQTPVDVVVEISDVNFLSARMALLCESYLNDMDSVFLVTDSFSGNFSAGSPAAVMCRSNMHILRTGKPYLSKSIASAQYRRAYVIDAYLAALPVLHRTDISSNRKWVTLTEFDTWFEPRLLCDYIGYLEEHRQRSSPSKIVLGGAGSGTFETAASERANWNAVFTSHAKMVSMPFGAMTIVPLHDLASVFSEASGGAVGCQERLLRTCAVPENTMQAAIKEVPCQVLQRSAQYRYPGAAFNNDHVFMACMVEGDDVSSSSKTISALWARPQTAARKHFSVNKYIFNYYAEAEASSVLAPSLRWNNFVGAHHVENDWLKSIITSQAARRTEPATGAWPTVFLLGNPKAATTSLFRYLTEFSGTDLCGGRVLRGEEHYYDKEPHAFDQLHKGVRFNESTYLKRYLGKATHCRRYIDATPTSFRHSHWDAKSKRRVYVSEVMLSAIPGEIRGASKFLVTLREPIGKVIEPLYILVFMRATTF